MEFALPAEMAGFIAREFGPRGKRWLDDLPRLVDATCRRFGIDIVGPQLPGGTHSYVVPVRRGGQELVLKIPMLDDENFAECAALRCYGGDGAVRLYDADLGSGALLLERADPGTALLTEYERGAVPLDEVVAVATGVLRRLRRVPSGDLSHPAPQPPGSVVAEPFPLVRDLASRWARELPVAYRRLAPALPAHAAELFAAAAERCTELATPDGPDVLVNRDAHTGNLLSGRGGTDWLLIDPKPVVGDAAFDAGHLLWDLLRYDPSPARADHLVARIAAGLDVDPARVRGWALVRAVGNLTWAVDASEADPYLRGAAALNAACR